MASSVQSLLQTPPPLSRRRTACCCFSSHAQQQQQRLLLLLLLLLSSSCLSASALLRPGSLGDPGAFESSTAAVGADALSEQGPQQGIQANNENRGSSVSSDEAGQLAAAAATRKSTSTSKGLQQVAGRRGTLDAQKAAAAAVVVAALLLAAVLLFFAMTGKRRTAEPKPAPAAAKGAEEQAAARVEEEAAEATAAGEEKEEKENEEKEFEKEREQKEVEEEEQEEQEEEEPAARASEEAAADSAGGAAGEAATAEAASGTEEATEEEAADPPTGAAEEEEEAADPAAGAAEGEVAEAEATARREEAEAADAAAGREAAEKSPAAAAAAAAAKIVGDLEAMAADGGRLLAVIESDEASWAFAEFEAMFEAVREEARSLVAQQQQLQEQQGEEAPQQEQEEVSVAASLEKLESLHASALKALQGLVRVAQQTLLSASGRDRQNQKSVTAVSRRLEALHEEVATCFPSPRINPVADHLFQADLNVMASHQLSARLSAALEALEKRMQRAAADASLTPFLLKEALAAAETVVAARARMERLSQGSLRWQDEAEKTAVAASLSAISECILEAALLNVELEMQCFKLETEESAEEDEVEEEKALLELAQAAALIKRKVQEIAALQHKAARITEPSATIQMLREAQLLRDGAAKHVKALPPRDLALQSAPAHAADEEAAASEEEENDEEKEEDAPTPKELAEQLRSALLLVVEAVQQAAKSNVSVSPPADLQQPHHVTFQLFDLGEQQELPSANLYKEWKALLQVVQKQHQLLQQQAQVFCSADAPEAVKQATRQTLVSATALQHSVASALMTATRCKAFRQAEEALAASVKAHAAVRVSLEQQEQQQEQVREEKPPPPMQSEAALQAAIRELFQRSDLEGVVRITNRIEGEVADVMQFVSPCSTAAHPPPLFILCVVISDAFCIVVDNTL
ncbi:hypothetical protein Efla_001495 [Eimeria flavescens]